MATQESDYGALDRRLFEEVWTRCELDEVVGIYSPQFVCHHPPDPDIVGCDGIREQIERTHSAYDDIRYVVDGHIASGDTTVTRWRMTGIVRRAVRGSAAEGQPVTITGMSMFRYANGLIEEEWTYWDQLGLKKQLAGTTTGK